jgi:hypothetical protein
VVQIYLPRINVTNKVYRLCKEENQENYEIYTFESKLFESVIGIDLYHTVAILVQIQIQILPGKPRTREAPERV